MTTINQKEYLKKYLGLGKAPGERKKKRKRDKVIGDRLKIIDDDADVSISQEIQDDIAAANEDAPQIVAVIDERPPSLRIDEETKSKLWKPIGQTSDSPSDAHAFRSSGGDYSPVRRRVDENNSPPSYKINKHNDNSPPRRKNHIREQMPSIKIKSERDFSPPGKNKDKKSRWGDWSPDTSSERLGKYEKMDKTLDGKKAGLQNAKDLVKETTLVRQREDEMFKNMSEDISGANAATVARKKKVKDLEEDTHKQQREKETKEKYDRWGKGLTQVENQNKKIAEQLHEMSKPLARYADDEDLEKYLKEQEREGDPMLAYMRKKKKKKSIAAGIPEKPMYMGEFMPNRFGIRPGYRWDGVDRSNGYEKRWFEVQNSKRASQEEAFKWSTEDM